MYLPSWLWRKMWKLVYVKIINHSDLRGHRLPSGFPLQHQKLWTVRLKICEPLPQVNFDLKQKSWHCLKVRSLESEAWWSFWERKHCAMFVSPSHSSFPRASLPTTCGLAVPDAPGIEQKSLNLEYFKEATQNPKRNPLNLGTVFQGKILCLLEEGVWERKRL